MGRIELTFVMLAGAIASAAACGDSPSVSAPRDNAAPPVPSPTAPTTPLVPSTPQPGTIGAAAREIPVRGRVLLHGPIYSLETYNEVYDGIAWTVSDTRVAAITPTTGPVGNSAILLDGLTPGRSELIIEGGGLRATVLVTVLDTVDAPSPVVVDDFFVIEHEVGGRWRYTPQIVVRDTSGGVESAAIGVWFELPGVGIVETCAMLRPVTGAPSPLFFGWGTSPELSLQGPPGYRAPVGGRARSQLTLRVPGPFAKRITLEGRIVSGNPPTARRPGLQADVLSCG